MHVEDGVYRAAGADFSRGGSKGQLAFGVTYLLPQALPAGSDSRQALAHHQGVSERIKALFISTNPPPSPPPYFSLSSVSGRWGRGETQECASSLTFLRLPLLAFPKAELPNRATHSDPTWPSPWRCVVSFLIPQVGGAPVLSLA